MHFLLLVNSGLRISKESCAAVLNAGSNLRIFLSGLQQTCRAESSERLRTPSRVADAARLRFTAQSGAPPPRTDSRHIGFWWSRAPDRDRRTVDVHAPRTP